MGLQLPIQRVSPPGASHPVLVACGRYNIAGVAGKVLTGVFLQTPSLKRSVPLYLPFQLAFLLSHFVLMGIDGSVLAGGGSLFDALYITDNTVRLTIFAGTVGIAYGFCASLMQCLVKEYFGLQELAKIQP